MNVLTFFWTGEPTVGLILHLRAAGNERIGRRGNLRPARLAYPMGRNTSSASTSTSMCLSVGEEEDRPDRSSNGLTRPSDADSVGECHPLPPDGDAMVLVTLKTKADCPNRRPARNQGR